MIPFRPPIRRGERAGRNKHEVFPVLAEVWRTGTEPSVGNLVFLTTFNTVDDDVIHRRLRTNVGNILAVGRPVVGGHGTDSRFFHDLPVPAFHIGYIQGIPLFAPENFLGIRGPFIIEDITFQIFDQFPLLPRRHVPKINIELPVLVGNITDIFPVRRPTCQHIIRIGRMGQVIGDSLFHGQRENIPASSHDHPFSTGSGRDTRNLTADIGQGRARINLIVINVYRDLGFFTTL